MNIPPEIIEEVRKRSSLAELTGDLPKFKRTGRGYSACCPFHEDSSPSFSINDEEGLFHCFGCGKKGSIFDYVMETRNLTFPEAVKFLANRAGVEIPERRQSKEESERHKKEKDRKVLLRELLASAIRIYQNVLISDPNTKYARDYVLGRGITPQTAEKFKIGFAPNSWDFITEQIFNEFGHKRVKTVEELVPELLALGLIKNRQSGEVADSETQGAKAERHYYDAFRNRVIFPITKSDGVPIALGGRILVKSNDAPKYINSPESLIYLKRSSFYGIEQGVDTIRKHRHAYLVEGYLDVISLHQRGILDSMATCGTAVTEEHAQILRRLVTRVTAMFDGDAAGVKAAAHCFPVFLNTGIDVSAVLLPEDEDPDSYARKFDQEAIEAYVATHRVPVIDVYLDQLLKQCGQEGTVNSAVLAGKAAQEFLRTIVPVKNPVEREFFIKSASSRLGVSVESLNSLFKEEQSKGAAFDSQKTHRHNFVKSIAKAKENFLEQPSVVENSQKENIKIRPRVESRSPARGKHVPISSYWQQLLVALVTEPRLAGGVLELPSLFEGGLVVEQLPAKVRSFVEDLRDGGYAGLPLHAQEVRRSAIAQELSRLLESHGFDSDALIGEAIRQAQFGGADPRKVVDDAQKNTARNTIKNKLDSIKEQEGRELNEGELMRLAQEKLKMKRKMEKVASTEKTNSDQ